MEAQFLANDIAKQFTKKELKAELKYGYDNIKRVVQKCTKDEKTTEEVMGILKSGAGNRSDLAQRPTLRKQYVRI